MKMIYYISKYSYYISKNIMFSFSAQDPLPVQKLVRKEGRRPAILLGLRDNENDYGVIKVMMIKMIMIMTE